MYLGYVGDKNHFMHAQLSSWKWYLKHLYYGIIHRLNNHHLIVDWMRAYLAVDTMAKIGFGQELMFNPKLSLLRKLISQLPAQAEPLNIPKDFNFKQITYEYFSPAELSQVISFFQHIETFDTPGGFAPVLRYANYVKKILKQDFAENFVSQKVLPACDSHQQSVSLSIINAKKLIGVLESLKHDIATTKSISIIDDSSIAVSLLLNKTKDLLNTIIQDDLSINVKSWFFKNIKPDLVAYNFIARNHVNYVDWTEHSRSCKEILQSLSSPKLLSVSEKLQKNWITEVRQNVMEKNPDLLFVFPLLLPDELNWENQHIGLGNTQLRRQTFLKASFYDQFSLQNCPIKTQTTL